MKKQLKMNFCTKEMDVCANTIYYAKNDKIRTTKEIIVEIQQKSEKREKRRQNVKLTKEEKRLWV